MKTIYRVTVKLLSTYTEVMSEMDKANNKCYHENQNVESIIRLTQGELYILTLYYYFIHESI